MRPLVAVLLGAVGVGCSAERVIAPAPAPRQSAAIASPGSPVGHGALVIVDGKVVDEAELARLDAATIASIDVFKGASAQQRYGHMSDRAANGVVVIILKSR